MLKGIWATQSKARPVKEVILEAIPATIELALFSLILALIVGIPWESRPRDGRTLVDRFGMTASFRDIDACILAQDNRVIVFSLRLGWFPTSGRITYGMEPTTITGLMTLDALITGDTQAFGTP